MGDILQERLDRVLTDSSQVAETLKVQGYTNNRFQRRASGKQEWGSGSATPDVALERESTTLMKLTGALRQAQVVTESTVASTLANHGISLLPSTGAVDYTLEAPVVGALKHIMVTGGSTLIKSITSNGATMGSTTTNKASIDLIGASLHLLGVSTSLWAIVGKSTAVTMSTA